MSDDEPLANAAVGSAGAEPVDGSTMDDATRQPSHTGMVTIVMWALASMGLLAYVVLGSTPAYIWRFNRQHREFKSVLGTWTIEANNLPQVSQQWFLEAAFYAALIVFLLGAIVGLWFLLQPSDDAPPPQTLPPAADLGPTTA